MRWRALSLIAILTGLSCTAIAQTTPAIENPGDTVWQIQTSNTTASLRGIHAVGNGIAWASGTNGTVLRTEDGGYVWQTCSIPPGAEKLDFRGIWGWDADTAIVMSSGPGDQSRIYKTVDGCHSWKLLFTNPDKDGFWDSVQFWDKQHGLILGDPISDYRFSKPEYKGPAWSGQHFVTLQTNDGGNTWKWKYPGRGEIPAAGKEGAGAFAASNSALTIQDRWAWFGVGGRSGAFVHQGIQILGDVQKQDGTVEPEGFAWFPAVSVPLASGTESSGVFSIAFRREPKTAFSSDKGPLKNLRVPARGVAVGGNYQKPTESEGTAAWTADGGRHWAAATKPPHGYRSAVAWDEADKAWLTVGTNGTDVSYDDGRTWQSVDNGNWNALSLPWAVGPNGRIGKLISLKGKIATSK